MKSNRCLFNKAIFKSDIKRFLPFAIPLLIVDLIIFPIIIYSNFNLPNDPLLLEDFVGISVAAEVFCFAFSGLFALLVFSYLYKANRCNAIHAFPIGRKGLFVSSFLAGYVLLTVPQLIGFAVSIPGIVTASKETAKILLMQFTSIFAESFIFYSVGVLAVMLAGNIFAGAVIYLIINFFFPAVNAITNVLVSSISVGISDFESNLFNSLAFSPVTELVAYKSFEAYAGTDLEDWSLAVGLQAFNSYYERVVIYLIVAVVFIALAYVFYKIRKLECAGDMAAFKIEIPIISVIVMFVGGSLMSMFVNIFVPYKALGFILLFIAFSFVVFIVTQMVLRKTPKIFTVKNMLLWAISCAVIICSIYLTSLYRTNYIPKVSKIYSMTVDGSYDITIKDEKVLLQAEKFHKALIENEKQKERNETSLFDRVYDYYNYDGYDRYQIQIGYVLKNGKTADRYYSFTPRETELVKMLDDLETLQHPDSVFTKLDGVEFTVDYVRCTEIKDQYDEEKYISPYGVDPTELFASCEKYVNAMTETYTTSKGISDEQYNRTATEYRVEFECSAKSQEDMNRLGNNGMYYYDPMGNEIGSQYGYTLNDNGEYEYGPVYKFTVTVYVKNGSEPYKMLSEIDNVKAS